MASRSIGTPIPQDAVNRSPHKHLLFVLPPGWLPEAYIAPVRNGEKIVCSIRGCGRKDLVTTGFAHCGCDEPVDFCRDCTIGGSLGNVDVTFATNTVPLVCVIEYVTSAMSFVLTPGAPRISDVMAAEGFMGIGQLENKKGHRAYARAFFEEAARLNPAKEAVTIGRLLMTDATFPENPYTADQRNDDSALVWLRKGVAAGDVEAKYCVALILLSRLFPHEHEECVKMLHEAAEGGQTDAMLQIAMNYAHGSHGYSSDMSQAKFWAELALKKGNADAQAFIDAGYKCLKKNRIKGKFFSPAHLIGHGMPQHHQMPPQHPPQLRPHAPPPSPQLHSWGVLRAKHSGMVIDVSGSSHDNGARVQQWSMHGGDNQLLRFEPAPDGWGVLRVKHSGKVLTVQGASHDNGGAVQQWDQYGGDNQLFRFEAVDNEWGAFRVKHHHSKALDVSEVSQRDGAALHQWDRVATAHNQLFRFFSQPAPPPIEPQVEVSSPASAVAAIRAAPSAAACARVCEKLRTMLAQTPGHSIASGGPGGRNYVVLSACKKASLDAGAVSALVNAMTNHSGAADVCEQASGALMLLTDTGDGLSTSQCHSEGAVPVLVAALRTHLGVEAVCLHASAVLWRVANIVGKPAPLGVDARLALAAVKARYATTAAGQMAGRVSW